MNIALLVSTAVNGTGPLASVAVYPVTLPDVPTLPAITYQIVSSVVSPTFSGAGGMKARVQFDIFATSYAQASSLRDSLTKTLHQFRGSLSDGTKIQLCNLMNIIDFPYASQALQYRLSSEFYVFYNL